MKTLATLFFLLFSVFSLSLGADTPRPPQHTVAGGDTLGKIAKRYQLSTRDLAAWNSLEPPYALRVGQPLRLSAPEAPASAPAPPAAEPLPAPAVVPPAPAAPPDSELPALREQITQLSTQVSSLQAQLSTVSSLSQGSLPPDLGLSEYPADIKVIKERGKLVVVQYQGERGGFFMYDNARQFPDYPSYEDGQGHVIGYDIELGHKIAERLGVKLELLRTAKNFTEACKMVGRGEADLALSKLTITLDRAQYVNFSKPYVELRLGVLINRLEEAKLGAVKLGAEQDLNALFNRPEARIAVETGTAWIDFARDLFPQAKLVEYPNLDATIDAVEKGQALAMLNDEWNIASALRMNPEIGVRVRLAFVPEVKTGLAAAVNPDKPNLLNFVNAVLERDNLQTSAAFLLDRYFAKGTAERISSSMALLTESAGETATDMTSILLIALLCLLILGVWAVLSYQRHHAAV